MKKISFRHINKVKLYFRNEKQKTGELLKKIASSALLRRIHLQRSPHINQVNGNNCAKKKVFSKNMTTMVRKIKSWGFCFL